MINKIIILLTILIFIYSCGKREQSKVVSEPTYEYNTNSEQYSYKDSDTLTQYKNSGGNEKVEIPKPINIEKYSQLTKDGVTIECKTTVEFVNGKTDNIIIKMQIPHEESNIINLKNSVKIADKSPELTSKMYTDDNGEKIIMVWRKDMSKISILNGDESVMFIR